MLVFFISTAFHILHDSQIVVPFLRYVFGHILESFPI